MPDEEPVTHGVQTFFFGRKLDAFPVALIGPGRERGSAHDRSVLRG